MGPYLLYATEVGVPQPQTSEVLATQDYDVASL